MKFLVVLASVVLAINAATDQELWLEFKKTHGRDYRNIKEEQMRFTIFQKSLRTIEEHNEKYEKGEESYYMSVNQFADMSQEEFRSLLTYNKASKPTLNNTILYKPSNVAAPNEMNWVSRGAVVGVKNQGDCGSCWSFSTTGALEGAYAIRYGTRISLSEQYLMDCSTSYGNMGCDGGVMEYAFEFVRDYGIEAENDYPYTGRLGYCRYSQSALTRVRVQNYYTLPSGSESTLQNAVGSVGPISVALNADLWQYYGGGIFDVSYCSQDLNHGVLVVGYGTQGSAYWLIKNSWGLSWGENGYIRLARNKRNQCGVASDASYPIVY